MARRRRSDLDESSYVAPAPPPTTSRPRRWLRRLIVLAAVPAIIVALAPQIVCRTPLLGRLVHWATTDLHGSVTLGETSLGWFSTPHVANVQLVDADGATVLSAEGVAGDRTLWQLISSPTRLGRFRIDQPTIELVLREDGTTNVEQVLAAFLQPSTATSSKPLDVAVQIVDGVLNVSDRATNRRWTINHLNAVVVLPGDAESPLVGDLQGSILSAAGPSRLSAQGSLRSVATADGKRQPQGDAAVAVEAFPLELVEAVLRRFVPGLALAGIAQGDLRARFDLAAAQPIGDASGRITLLNPVVGGPLLAGDEMRLSRVDLPLRLTIEGNRLQVDQLAASCELASLELRGSLDHYERLADVTGLAQLVNLLVECDGRATAKLDLARIAQVLPHLLRVRDDVQITGGDLTLTASSDGRPGDRRQQIELTTSGISAQHNGAAIVWDQPLRAVATTRDAPGGPVVERVQCQSDFLTIDGVNAADSFQLTANYDLARLGQRLAQFVDLGTLQLRGQGTAKGAWLRQAAQRFNVEGQATINDFALVMSDTTWTERQLTLGLEAAGRADGLSIAALESAAAGMQSDGDELTVRVTQPIVDLRQLDVSWPIEIAGKGELATWLARIRPFAGLPVDAVARGHVELNGTAKVRLPGDVEIVSSRLTAQPLQLAIAGIVVDEPTAELQLAGRYSPTETTIREATLTSPGVQSQIRQFVWKSGAIAKSNELSGDATLRADLPKLVALFGAAKPGGPQWAGAVEGAARLQMATGVTNVALDGVVNNFAFSQPGGAAWQERIVKLNGTGKYDPAGDAVSFDRLELSADALRVLLAGRVSQVSSARVVECNGELDYDLTRLTPLVQSYLGTGVALAGREAQRFEIVGPLADPTRGNAVPWDKLTGAAGISWQGANLYGLQMGRGALDAKLAQGVLRTNPLEVPVNTGRLRLTPSLRLAPGPMELNVDPGTLVDHVSITPEMANERLKYVLPILAGVAQVSGQFSVAIDELKMPLDNPQAGTVGGRITVHAVDVGPNALTQELATLLQQPLTMSLTRESVVDFKMIQGRIYHQGLELAFPEVKVRTHGSVGLDQTVSLIAEFTLPQRLFANQPIAGAALSSQVIRLPIGGTLQNMQLDRQAFAAATSQFLQNAAQGAVEEGINRGLQRLFGPGALAPQPGTTTK